MTAGVFSPHPLLRGPHRQTMAAYLLPPGSRPAWRPERLDLPDGDFVDLAHLPGAAPARVCFFHGLEGSLASHYVGGIAAGLQARGVGVTFMHFRGCSGEANRLPRAYHSGDTGDIATVLATMARREPASALGAVGVSLGGNALLKYLGEQGAAALPRAAVAVSVPFDLAVCADRIDTGFSRLYQRRLVAAMKRATRARRRRQRSLPIDLDTMERARSFRDFDDCVTAPLHGFADADDYYARASSAPWLPRIAVPVRLIQALDDPFVGPDPVPGPGAVAPATELAVSAHGGHVGFIAAGPRGGPQRWLDGVVPRWLERRLVAGPAPAVGAT